MNIYEVIETNKPAINLTRYRVDKDGIEWDRWMFYPSDGYYSHEITDGHPYTGVDRIPVDGWRLL